MEQEQKHITLSLQPNPRGIMRVCMVLVCAVLIMFLTVETYTSIKSLRTLTPQNVISVSGEGKVFVKPDIGQVTVSIKREAKTVAEAQKQATDAGNSVLNFLKSKSVEEKDIRTVGYTINPLYDYIERRGSVFRGYEVRQSLEVKIRNLDAAGDILSGVADKGANEVGGLSFTTEDPKKIQEAARSKAIADAKDKAVKLARELGVTLGDIITFNEFGGGYPPPIYYSKATEGMGGGVMAPAPDIPVGQNETAISVTIVYEIK